MVFSRRRLACLAAFAIRWLHLSWFCFLMYFSSISIRFYVFMLFFVISSVWLSTFIPEFDFTDTLFIFLFLLVPFISFTCNVSIFKSINPVFPCMNTASLL